MMRHDAEHEAFQHVVIEFLVDAPEHRSEPLRPLRRPRDARRFSLATRDARPTLHLVARESVLGGLAGSAAQGPGRSTRCSGRRPAGPWPPMTSQSLVDAPLR